MKYLILMAARQDDKGFEIGDCGFSIGHLALPSFVVIGRGQRTEDGRQKREDRDYSVGAAFSRDLVV
jgi:hypothetical protein